MISALLLTGCKKTGDAYSNDPDGTSNLTGTGTMYVGNESTGGESEGDGASSEQNEQQDDGTVTDDQTVEDQSADTQVAEGEDPEEDVISDVDLLNLLMDAANTLEISVIVVNLCGVDIGMVAIIDPYTGEQVNLGPLPVDQVMNVSEYWPMDKTDFDIAIYNMAGDLVAESEIDVTGIQESLTITFSGDGDLENVDSRVE